MPALLNGSEKSTIKIVCAMPIQRYDIEGKLAWLEQTIQQTPCDLFLTPQEFLGGHYVMPKQRHVDRQWLFDTVGDIARRNNRHIGIGACVKTSDSGAMEDYWYFDDDGVPLGRHSKFALPSYDDVRTSGHGQLWPETNYAARATPIDLPKLRLRIGTVFCWEVFSQTLFSAYSFARTNLIVHPIKFAPRGWLKNQLKSDGLKHIVGFGNAPASQMWVDRLIMAGRHQCLCPIAVSCNSWNLGPKFMALVGHVDELKKTTNLQDVPSLGDQQYIHIFEMLPEWYEGLDHHHSAGAFKAHVGSVEGFSELGEWTMHTKIRRIEAQLIGGTAKLDCQLKGAAVTRQKNSTVGRAFGKKQPVKLPKK